MNAEPNYMTSTLINNGPLNDRKSIIDQRLSELKQELKQAKKKTSYPNTPRGQSVKKRKKKKKVAHYMLSTIVKGGPNQERSHYVDRDGKQKIGKNIKPLEMSVIQEENGDIESAIMQESKLSENSQNQS